MKAEWWQSDIIVRNTHGFWYKYNRIWRTEIEDGNNTQGYVSDAVNSQLNLTRSVQASNTGTTTDSLHSSISSTSFSESVTNNKTVNFRTLADIYSNNWESQVRRGWVILIAVDEPTSYK